MISKQELHFHAAALKSSTQCGVMWGLICHCCIRHDPLIIHDDPRTQKAVSLNPITAPESISNPYLQIAFYQNIS